MRLINISFSLCLILISGFTLNAQDAATANDRQGVVLFVESMPANQYRHSGTIECAMFSPDEADPLIDHILKRAKDEYEEFDALIFRSGKGLCKADVVNFYKDPKAKRRRGRAGEEPEVDEKYKKARAVPRNGTLVFVYSSPTSEYDLLGKVETPVTFRSKNVEDLISEVVRTSKEAYPDLDAVVIVDGSGLRKANAIKFK
ncbi:MAG: hypothetical protein WEC59_11140 [Salibacteraceae bacterium]